MEEHLISLKEKTKQLIDDIGIERAVKYSGNSRAVLVRNYSSSAPDTDRFMNIDDVAALEAHASYPFLTSELAHINGNRVNTFEVLDIDPEDAPDGIIKADKSNPQVVAICNQFALFMYEYQMARADKVITKDETDTLFSKIAEMDIMLVTLKKTLVGILSKP